MLDRGYLRVVRLWGAELRVHWSVLVAVALAGQLRLEPVRWLGLLAVLIVHQVGHVLAVAVAGGRVLGIDTTGVGGSCRWRGAGSGLERARGASWVAWGGILAQAVLLALALAFSAQLHASPVGGRLSFCWVELNLALLAINLLPFAPLDGAQAWRALLRGSRWGRARELWLDGAVGGSGWEEESSSPAPSAGISLTPRSAPRDPAVDPAYAPTTPHSARYRQATTDDADAEDEALTSPRPSAQAQREIDALLRRVEDRVARSRRDR